ncbi:glycosyltransferase family 29 protein, partial [Escherichia coli]
SRLCSDVSLRNLNKSQKLRLAIMLYQNDKDAKANEIIKQIGKKFLLKYTSSPYVFNKIKKNKIFNDPYIQRGSEQYSHILKSRNEFIKSIRNSAGSFCIVGNAPTEINTGHGALIDSKKTVIRINNYTLDYPDDYGTKQDIWVRVANKEVSNNNLKNNRLVIFAANNFTIKRRDANKYFLAPQLMEMEYTVIPNHVYKSLIKKLDGLPSTGLAVAYWVYSI